MSKSETTGLFAAAFAQAQAEMNNAGLNKTNPHYKNRYADLAAIRDAVIPPLAKNGIGVWQGTRITDAGMVLATLLLHKSGEWIESEYPLPVALDKPQVMGSAITYARRYSLAAACGITADEDDDAEDASKGKPNGNGTHPRAIITPEQVKTLRTAIKEVDANEPLFLQYLSQSTGQQVPSVEAMPAALFERALEKLNSKRAATAADKKAVRK